MRHYEKLGTAFTLSCIGLLFGLFAGISFFKGEQLQGLFATIVAAGSFKSCGNYISEALKDA